MSPYVDLHTRCTALGTRLFTVTALDEVAGLHRRVYTSHPVEYPLSGTKPLERDGWYDTTITGGKTFVANTPPEFERYFFDHALITSLGLGSCINIPVQQDGPILGPILGTVNLLAEAMHFTDDRISAYEALVTDARSALCDALSQVLRDQSEKKPMARRPAETTPIEAFLARLAKVARKYPEIEGLVFWGGAEGWNPSPSEELEAEEVAFYAEGLLIDGFNMDWTLVAETGLETEANHLRLCFWQDGDPPPALLSGWHAVDGGHWTASDMHAPG